MISAHDRPIALVIFDGWGVPTRTPGDAWFHASTPYLDGLARQFPSTELSAAGPSIGLPEGAAGSAEVGHMTIGAGRTLKTDAARVADALASGEFFENETLKEKMSQAAGARLHLVGLVSDGDVHSSSETLYALLRMAKRSGVREAYVHAILDGRDVPPRTAEIYLEALEVKMDDIGLGKIASLCGRFFAMDSGENWERTARAFTMLVYGEGERFPDAVTAVRGSFLRGISDEFIAPVVIEKEPDVPVATIRAGDVVVFFNHRADTMKQLVRSLAVADAASPDTAKPAVNAVCIAEYDPDYNLPVVFPTERGGASVASVLNDHKRNNYRISEADRFSHVTDLFNCGVKASSANEFRISLPAASATVGESGPEMMSFKTTDRLLRAIEADPSGVFIVNLPAADIAAETGDFRRTVEAVQYLDTCLGGIVRKIRNAGGAALITSTHASHEIELGADGRSAPQASGNVPCYLVDDSSSALLRRGGSLQDVGATLLAMAGLDVPPEMTGRDLRTIRPI